MKITYPDTTPAAPKTLKITYGEQIYRLLFEDGLRLGGFAAVKAAIKDALQPIDSFTVRYKCKEGKDKILSDKNFGHFLATASGPNESTHKVLRLDVSTAKTPDTALSRQSHSTWQQDPRNLEELLAQFSDEDVKVKTEPPTCARRSRTTKQKKKEGTRKASRLAETRPLDDEHGANNMETSQPEDDGEEERPENEAPKNVGNDPGPEQGKEWLSEEQTEEKISVREDNYPKQEELQNDKYEQQDGEEKAEEKRRKLKKNTDHDDDGDDDYDDGGEEEEDEQYDEFKQCAENILESADGLSRSKSCPCLPTHQVAKTPKTDPDSPEQFPEDVGCIWPATPDSTPPSSPRQGCGQHHMAWVPVPVWIMPRTSITAY